MTPPSRILWLSLVLGLVAAAIPAGLLRGFTVDDALIPARYASHLARGLGYRFNADSPVTDGVTPLGWAHLLAPFARSGTLAAFRAARIIGIVSFLGASAALGLAINRSSRHPARFAALLLLLCSAPLGAWTVSGLETGLVLALATAAAAAPPHPAWSAPGGALAGLVAWLRPEMLPYAIVLGAGRARLSTGRKWLPVALAVLPWCIVVAVRLWIWGRPAPLALWAKPSDLYHGFSYLGACALLTGGPIAVFAPWTARRLSSWPRTLLVGAATHGAVVALVGGDWMPLSRLIAPVLPSLALVWAHEIAVATRSLAFATLRLALGLSGELFAAYRVGPAAAHVLPDRLALIAAAKEPLAGAERVAAVDVGWVGAATEAEIIDLAGATDPEIAALPGGHTSKLVGGAFLTQRRPDRIVLELAARAEESDGPPLFARIVEERLAEDPRVMRTFEIVWRSPPGSPVRYAILARTPVTSTPRDSAPRTE